MVCMFRQQDCGQHRQNQSMGYVDQNGEMWVVGLILAHKVIEGYPLFLSPTLSSHQSDIPFSGTQP